MRKQNWEISHRYNTMHDRWIVKERTEKTRLKEESIDYSKEYLYFEALEDGMTASFTKKAKSGSLYYSLDKQEWNELTESQTINSGEKVYFKGDLVPAAYSGTGTFTINKQCNVAGNIMSLLFADDFVGKTDLTGYDYAFKNLFGNCTTAENLILPATTLANNCYSNMFYRCTRLTSAPVLPATTLTKDCYSYMFSGCTSLTTAPELPATTLSNFCYTCMFQGCSSLTSVPELPATTLASSCYNTMFAECSSLTTAPELPATTLATSCYQTMFYGCKNLNYIKMLATGISASNCLKSWVQNVASTGTFVKAGGVEIPAGTDGIPEGWTVQTI